MHCWMRFLLVQSALLLAVITNWQSRDDLQQNLTNKPESAVMAPQQHTHHAFILKYLPCNPGAGLCIS